MQFWQVHGRFLDQNYALIVKKTLELVSRVTIFPLLTQSGSELLHRLAVILIFSFLDVKSQPKITQNVEKCHKEKFCHRICTISHCYRPCTAVTV